ncbi:Flp family type IVb pilin [Stieleria varia]|uniref:Uncharacterized protein n=1 Tax=Stieleria varia TaxID=2528005 RepID=A0A5C6B3M6_9BACT|nr:hypothetical protein [Stieleria varia]TWU06071.1 hypothetical protein Pla52n_17910 [Stieleria varia]
MTNKPDERFSSTRCCVDVFIRLWRDEQGFVVTMELVLIATILVIGLIAGLTALRDAVVSELTDVARSVQEMNQSYQTSGVAGTSASTAGSGYSDHDDPGADHCIVMFGPIGE